MELYHFSSLQLNFIRLPFFLDSVMREMEGSYSQMMMMAKPSMIVFSLVFYLFIFYYWRPIPRSSGNFLFHLVLSFSHPAAGPQGATTQTRLGAIHIIVSSSSVYFSSFFFPGAKWRMVLSFSSSWLDSLLRPLNIPSVSFKKTKKIMLHRRDITKKLLLLANFLFPLLKQLNCKSSSSSYKWKTVYAIFSTCIRCPLGR